MCGNVPLRYWKVILTHEAGHAVAAIAMHDRAEDIFVKETHKGPQRSLDHSDFTMALRIRFRARLTPCMRSL